MGNINKKITPEPSTRDQMAKEENEKLKKENKLLKERLEQQQDVTFNLGKKIVNQVDKTEELERQLQAERKEGETIYIKFSQQHKMLDGNAHQQRVLPELYNQRTGLKHGSTDINEHDNNTDHVSFPKPESDRLQQQRSEEDPSNNNPRKCEKIAFKRIILKGNIPYLVDGNDQYSVIIPPPRTSEMMPKQQSCAVFNYGGDKPPSNLLSRKNSGGAVKRQSYSGEEAISNNRILTTTLVDISVSDLLQTQGYTGKKAF